MTTKNDILRELFIKNGLVKGEDTFEMMRGGKKIPIITRTGIEKIQANNNIHVTYTVEAMTPDFIVIRATAQKGDVVMESFGEASPNNTRNEYPVSMAEKRALARAVLKMEGFYKYGAYGEDEAESFKRQEAA
jgi:hypothetical protein